MKTKPGMSFNKAKKAELEKAKIDERMGEAMRGAGMDDDHIKNVKQNARRNRNRGEAGVHTSEGNFLENKRVATQGSRYVQDEAKLVKPKLEKAKVDDGKANPEKVKAREARNSRYPKGWDTGLSRDQGQFAGKPYSNSPTQSGVHEQPGDYKKGARGSFRDSGGRKDKIDHQATHTMVKQGLKNLNPKLPDAKVKKSEFKSGLSYREMKKAELEKGIFHDVMAGISLGGALAAAGTAHMEHKMAHMPLGHAVLEDTGGQTTEMHDPARTISYAPSVERVQTMKQKIGEIRKKIKPSKDQE